MNPFRKLASQTAIYGLPTIIGRLLNYLLVPLYTYNFSTEEYGTVNEMYAYVSFLLIVLTYGMETALFNFSRKQEDKEKVYSVILLCVSFTSVLFITAAWMFSGSIASLIQYPQHPEYITWFGLILGFDAISSIAFARLREQQRPKAFAVIKTLNIAVNIFLNLFFIVYCRQEFNLHPEGWVSAFYRPEIGIGYIFISNVAASAVTLLVQTPSLLGGLAGFFRSGGHLKEIALLRKILPYSLPLLVAGLAGMTNETMDRILLKYLLPEDVALHQIGVYGACYKISIIMTIFIQTFRYAAEPFFFAHASDKDARSIYARVMNYFVIICLLIFLGTWMNISWIQYFVGKDFREGIGVVPILLLANFCLGVFMNLSIWYKLTGRTRWGAYLTIMGAVITLAGNFFFIPKYGYMASAWTTLACYAAMMVVSYLAGDKHYPVNYDLRRLLGYLALSLLLFALAGITGTGNAILDILVRNALLLGFAGVVFYVERNNLKRPHESKDHQQV